jgi:hypothetical protein
LYTKLKALLYQTAGNPARYCEIEMVVARPLQEPSSFYMVQQDHEQQIYMRRLMKKIQVLADDRELQKHIVLDGGTFFVWDSFFVYSVLNCCIYTHFSNPYPFTSNTDLFPLQHLKRTRMRTHRSNQSQAQLDTFLGCRGMPVPRYIMLLQNSCRFHIHPIPIHSCCSCTSSPYARSKGSIQCHF